MATGSIPLNPGATVMPDGSASNAFPQPLKVKSSAAAPGPYSTQLAFDASTEEWVCWSFRMPADYASAPVAKIQYKMTSATTGGVAWDVRLAAISDGDATDADAKAFGSANVGTATVPGTAGHIDEVSITLTNADSVAAGDFVTVRLARAVANAGDTATGDAEFMAGSITYTTT